MNFFCLEKSFSTFLCSFSCSTPTVSAHKTGYSHPLCVLYKMYLMIAAAGRQPLISAIEVAEWTEKCEAAKICGYWLDCSRCRLYRGRSHYVRPILEGLTVIKMYSNKILNSPLHEYPGLFCSVQIQWLSYAMRNS